MSSINFIRGIFLLPPLCLSVHTRSSYTSMSALNLLARLKSLSNKVGGILRGRGSPKAYMKLDRKLELKMIEAQRSSRDQRSFKSINSIIMRFPDLRQELKNIKRLFQRYDQDANEIIDRGELQKCLEDLNIHLSEEEVEDLFRSCNMDRDQGIQFKEFIVLLCLIYILAKSSTATESEPKLGSRELEATFEAIVEAFVFLDKNGDGKLNKDDVVNALDDPSPFERFPAHVTKKRLKEMDLDRNGMVSFRGFLFAFIKWIGLESDQEELARS